MGVGGDVGAWVGMKGGGWGMYLFRKYLINYIYLGKFGENQPEFEVWELLLYNCPANRANTPRIPTISQLQTNLFELGLFRNG